MFYISGTHAQAVNDRLAFKLSAGGYTQDPYARPDRPDSVRSQRRVLEDDAVSQLREPGHTQPKFDMRVDYDLPDGKKWSFSGGVAGTDGIMHTGIGPFDIDSGSVMGYGKANFSNKGFKAAFFTNILNGDATNLLTVDATTSKPVAFDFATKTFDFEASDVKTFQGKHVVTYGGNLRFNGFDLSLAPDAQNRTEGGGYAQDEIFLSDHYRLVAGARVDRFDYLDNFVFSPRVSFMLKPTADHTVRLSYNRAYRSPSVINNFLERHDRRAAQPRAVHADLCRRRLSVAGAVGWQSGPERDVRGRVRGRAIPASRCTAGRSSRRRSTSTAPTTTSSSPKTPASGTPRRIRRPVSRRRSSRR